MATTASAINLPFQEAVDYFRQKTNMPSKHWTAVMDEAHARSFAVAGAASKSLVQDFREAVDKAISQGTGLKEFRKQFDMIVQKHGWSHTGKADWRARIIYQTNMANAFAAGRYAQMTQPDVLAAFPYWEYLHVNCPNPRLQHVAWSGMVLRADDPFWASCYPPNGWNCHCIVATVSDRGLARMGKSGPDASPPLQWRTYEDRTTGVVTRHPAGVDPGFAYNPGKAWKDNAAQPVKAPNVKPVGAAPPVLAPPGKTAVRPDVLQAFIAKPEGAVQVVTLDAKTLKALGGRSPNVLLSRETMRKQLGLHIDNDGHPEVFVKDYAALDGLISTPAIVLENRPMHVQLIGLANGTILTAVVKRTKSGHETYLQTAWKLNQHSLARILKTRKILHGSPAEMLKQLKDKRVR